MDTETRQAETTALNAVPWVPAVVAGLVGGLVFSALLTMMMPPVIAGAIPALVGLQGLAAGWVVHTVDAIVFALVFAAITTNVPSLDGSARTLRTGWLVGIGWGFVLWIVAAGLVMPLWLSTVGFPMAPPFPNFNPATLPGHVVYGAIVGLIYSYLTDR